VKAVFYLPVAPHPGRQGGGIGVAVAGDEVDDLDGLLSVPGDGAAQLRDLGHAVELDPGRDQRHLDRPAGPAAVIRAYGRERGDGGPGQLLQPLVQGQHVALDGHHVVRLPADDGLGGVTLRVQGVNGDDGDGQAANAFSISRTAGISFDFASTAWPRTAPMPRASAATRCGALPVARSFGCATDRGFVSYLIQ